MNFIIIGGLIILGLVIFQSMYYAKKIQTLRDDNYEMAKRLNEEVAKRIANNKDGRKSEMDMLTNY